MSVVVITADAEGCAQVDSQQVAESGMCPPIKVHVPYPGFDGNYGVNAMYHHAGVKHGAVWYQHAVPLSAEHPASTLSILKNADKEQVTWKLVRRSNNSNDSEVVSECARNVGFPWLCGKFWNPPIEVTELSWNEAHKHALSQVKAGLRWAEAVKAMSAEQKTTNKLTRAADNVKHSIARVKEIEKKASKLGHVFDQARNETSTKPPADKAATIAKKTATKKKPSKKTSATKKPTKKTSAKKKPAAAGTAPKEGLNYAEKTVAQIADEAARDAERAMQKEVLRESHHKAKAVPSNSSDANSSESSVSVALKVAELHAKHKEEMRLKAKKKRKKEKQGKAKKEESREESEEQSQESKSEGGES